VDLRISHIVRTSCVADSERVSNLAKARQGNALTRIALRRPAPIAYQTWPSLTDRRLADACMLWRSADWQKIVQMIVSEVIGMGVFVVEFPTC
jgi:hypothetical protein